MFTELEKLLDLEQFQELFEILAEGGEYNYSENGLNISAKSSDNCISLQIKYEEPKITAESEAKDFQKFLEDLDDDLFMDVCESLGQDNIARIHDCIHSTDIESVRSGVIRFKKEYREVLNNKINYYIECLNNLDK